MKKLISIILLAFVATLAYSAPVLVPMNNAKEYARLSENKKVLVKGDYKTGKEDTLVVFSKMRQHPLEVVEAFRFSPQEDKILLTAQFNSEDAEMYLWQWQYSEDGNEPWTDIEGAMDFVLELENTEENCMRYYRLQGYKMQMMPMTFSLRQDRKAHV